MKSPIFISGTYGSSVLARMRWLQYANVLGDNHPATRAALGRWLALRRWVPQRGLYTPESIAWHRESRAAPGYMNRGERRAIARLFDRGWTSSEIARAFFLRVAAFDQVAALEIDEIDEVAA